MMTPVSQRRLRSTLVVAAFVIAACSGSNSAVPVDNATSDPATKQVAAATSPPETSAGPTDIASDATRPSAPPTTIRSIDCGVDAGPGTIGDREFALYLPDDIGMANNPTGLQSPLLVLLHGFAGNGIEFAATTGLETLAPESGVVLAAPQGIGDAPTWHIGSPDDPLVASDLGFLGALVDELIASPCINPDNVWLAGFSAGSAYTGVYGCANVDRFRGLAMISGLPPALCPADANTSIQITHGTDDPVVPFGGGAQTISDTEAVELDGVAASAAGWAEVAGCGEPVELVFGDTNPSSVTAWHDCAGQAEVSLLAVTGLGHVWAGSLSPDGSERITPIVDAGCVIVHQIIDADGDRFDSCFG